MADVGFAELIERIRSGDDEAVAELIARFGPEVRAMVRARLPAKIRGQFDSMDFAQDVWSVAFVNCRDRPEAFDDSGHLMSFLAAVVRNKVGHEHRRLTRTLKYDVRREEPLYVERNGHASPRDVVADDPTPSEYVQADDRLEQLTDGLPPDEVSAIRLRAEGLTFDEVGERLGVHEKWVRRVIDALRDRMERRRW